MISSKVIIITDILIKEILEENNLWEVEKLVTEFRKLFTDKTTFMNFYSSAGVLQNKISLEEVKLIKVLLLKF